MKFAALLLVLILDNSARAENILCYVNSDNKATDIQGFAELKDIKWGKQFSNSYTLSNGETGSFTIHTEMVNPDSGYEQIIIHDQNESKCQEERLFTTNEQGQSIYNGVRTACSPSTSQSLSVSCWWM